MRTFLIAALAAALAAAAATWARYESFSPCDWMEHDLAASTGLPRLVVTARVRAQFLIEGVTDPDMTRCILAWWRFRADGLPADAATPADAAR
jgi:hypothetical protein